MPKSPHIVAGLALALLALLACDASARANGTERVVKSGKAAQRAPRNLPR